MGRVFHHAGFWRRYPCHVLLALLTRAVSIRFLWVRPSQLRGRRCISISTLSYSEGSDISICAYLCTPSGVWWAWWGPCSTPPCNNDSASQQWSGDTWGKRLHSRDPTICTAPCWNGSAWRVDCSCKLKPHN